ncbi:MAG: hypothetical protein CMA72_07810 [Euryarchaeota archaeon]|nr:hypothetical protein [Euryarchaeota archaeon]
MGNYKMNYTRVVFVSVMLYITLLLINTNSLEKKMMYTLLNDADWWTITHHSVKYDPGLINYIQSPFYFDRNRLTKVSRGQIYDAYCFTKPYAKIQEQMQSKMFWNEYLPNNGINVPKLYATTKPYKLYDFIEPDDEYVSKPEFGTAGSGIKLIRGKDVKSTETNHLIQAKIGSCGYDGARSYRVVTTYDGEVLVMYEFKSDETITSNISSNERATAEEKTEVPEIERTVKELCRLHARDFDFCFSIGWDLMVDCEDGDPTYSDVYVLEGNWPSGIFGDTINRNDKFINMVNEKARKFYKLSGL